MRNHRIPCFMLLMFLALLPVWGQSKETPAYELTPNKELMLPDIAVFRDWVHVGQSLVPDDKNQNKAIFPGIHLVYMDPASFEFRQERGVFRDGTIILMEVLHVKSQESESGYGYFTNGGQDVLVAIKDRRIFPNSGWAYYLFEDKDLKAGKKVTAVQSVQKCQACHISGAEDDEVFIQYYPALRHPDYKTK